MLQVPAGAFYVATTALVVVCIFIGVLLFYLIKIARTLLRIFRAAEHEGKRAMESVERVRDTIRTFIKFFFD